MMPTELTTGVGLDAVIWLQTFDHPVFDALAIALHFIGRTSFFLIVMPLIYWSVDKQLGLRLIGAMILAGIFIAIFKEVFKEPRPFEVAPSRVDQLFDQEDYGFPSGHVLQAIVIWGTAALYLKKRWAYWAVGILAVLTAWSRVYAGVHYVQDVIGGLILGLLALWLSIPLFRSTPDTLGRLPLRSQIALTALLGLVVLVVAFENRYGPIVTGVIWGVGAGLILDQRRLHFSARGPVQQRVLRYAGGLVLIGILYLGSGAVYAGDEIPLIPEIIIFTLIGFIAMGGWPWLALRLGLMQQQDDKSTPTPETS